MADKTKKITKFVLKYVKKSNVELHVKKNIGHICISFHPSREWVKATKKIWVCASYQEVESVTRISLLAIKKSQQKWSLFQRLFFIQLLKNLKLSMLDT